MVKPNSCVAEPECDQQHTLGSYRVLYVLVEHLIADLLVAINCCE